MNARPHVDSVGEIWPSHQSLIDELEWASRPAIPDDDRIKSYFDLLWISPQHIIGRRVNFDSYRKSIVNLSGYLEENIAEVDSVGAYPLFTCLHDSPGSLEELKCEHRLTLDTPLLGVYIIYQESFNAETERERVDSIRANIGKELRQRLENVNLIWGYTDGTIQAANIVYFSSEDQYVIAQDRFPGMFSPHSLYLDYSDILFGDKDQDPSREIRFQQASDSGPFESESSPTLLGDIDIKFDVVEVSETEPIIKESFNVPIVNLQAKQRNLYAMRFNNRVK